jgi:hypothetical protein
MSWGELICGWSRPASDLKGSCEIFQQNQFGSFSGLTSFSLSRYKVHMPCKLRIQYPGAMYHVMSRGNRERIFLDVKLSLPAHQPRR